MAELAGGASRLIRIAAMVLVVAVVAGLIYVLTGGGTKTGVAYFKEAKSIYPGDAIRVLGMQVGQIDKIAAEGDRVRVDFHYDSKYQVPAEAKAVILSPTLVATRFIQLDPAYSGGPELEDGAVIPLERTVVPVEFDELKAQLSQLSDALGPNGANKEGALNRALTVIDRNGRQNGVGQGQPFHDMIVELSKAAKTVSDGRGDLFGTVRNLAEFSSALVKFDDQIVQFQRALAETTDTLDKDSDSIRQFFPQLKDTGQSLDDVLIANFERLTETIDRSGAVSRMLAKRRDDIAQVLHAGPTTLTDFNNIWHPREQRLTGTLVVNELETLGGPGDAICALITTAATADQKTGQEMCVKYLGPVFQHLAQKPPPVAIEGAPIAVPRGSAPPGGGPTNGVPNTNGTGPDGTNSDAPRSETANGNGHTYDDTPGPGSLFGLMGGK